MKKGFTLSEVLITMAILGVVAALTLPALQSNIAKQSIEKQVAKFYANMTTAVKTFMAENDVNRLTGIDFDEREFVKKYFNISGYCKKQEDCLPKEYSNIEGEGKHPAKEPFTFEKEECPVYVLADGTVFQLQGYKCMGDEGYPIQVYFDTNGKKGPNKIGYDLQYFDIFYDGSIDESSLDPKIKNDYNKIDYVNGIIKDRFDSCKEQNYGGCFGHFIRNGFKFDY